MKMVRAFAPALLIAPAFLTMLSFPSFTAPVAAQRSERVLVIYGNDKCPSSGGEEIVVCSRKPESERYRIPEELRKSDSRANETWGDRASSLEYVGKTGVNSCSPIGPGGANGCVRELTRKACDENKADGKKCGIKF